MTALRLRSALKKTRMDAKQSGWTWVVRNNARLQNWVDRKPARKKQRRRKGFLDLEKKKLLKKKETKRKHGKKQKNRKMVKGKKEEVCSYSSH